MGLIVLLVLLFNSCNSAVKEDENETWPENIQTIIDNTNYLEFDRGTRLPLYLWPAIDPGAVDANTAEAIVKELDKRGVGVVCSWKLKDLDESLSRGIIIAKAQKKFGLRVNIDATSLLYGFYNGEDSTAHIDSRGNQFFDDSFGTGHKMGCPFILDSRKDEIRRRVEYCLKSYKDQGLQIDFIFADWEIDGPIEVNSAYESSGRCVRCREHLGEDFGFEKFQETMRQMRAYLQHYSYSSPVLSYFPDALVGNYAVYPNDGYRYWYDYFEFFNDIHPHKTEQKAHYRKWFNDFPLTGYTFAMPVIYPWKQIYYWYDFDNTDYRWFYNMLMNAGNAGKSTPHNIPVISFVHYNTVFAGSEFDPAVKQMSRETYRELLWHMLLRGTDTFFMWSGKKEFAEETRLLHEVYSAAQEYGDFLDQGVPVIFDIPDKPGVVISGLALGDKVLVRRTDFNTGHRPVEVLAGTKIITVNYMPGVCQIIDN